MINTRVFMGPGFTGFYKLSVLGGPFDLVRLILGFSWVQDLQVSISYQYLEALLT